MTADFERVAALFERARHLDPAARAELLEAECDDASLRREVEELLGGLEGHPALADEALDAVREHLHAVSATWFDGEGAAVPAAPMATPETIGPFRVVRRLGSGGMGTVWEALQDAPRRAVAVKVLDPRLSTAASRRRFEREAEILARLRHPGIAQIFATGVSDLGHGEQPWFAMELIDGRPLDRHCEAAGLDRDARLRLVIEVADAVHHAHTRGIVHRDLKPENVLVTPEGRPKVVDFGVAHVVADADRATRHTTPGEVLGTLTWMAPEQVRGDEAAQAPTTDVFALGALTYLLLAGRPPRDLAGVSFAEAARRVDEGRTTPLAEAAPHLPRDLCWIVDKALADAPDRRYGSTLALADDLRRFLAAEPVQARPPSPAYRAERFVARNRGVVASLATAFLALAAALAVSVARTNQTRAARAEAERQAERATAINEFLLERMLAAYSPLDLGAEVRVADVLEIAAPEIDTAFAAFPATGAAVRHTLGRSLAQLGLFEQAVDELERAADDLARELGPAHPETLAATNDLLSAELDLLRNDSALARADAALARLAGPPSPASLELAAWHAEALIGTGRIDDALAAADRALATIRARFAGSDEAETVLGVVAAMHGIHGDPARGEALLREALAETRARHGAGDPREVELLLELAWACVDRGKEQEGLDLSAEALERARDQFGPDHPTTLLALATRASVLTDTRRLEAALPVVEATVDAYRRLLGPDHSSTYITLSNQAILLRRLGRYDEALALAREVLDGRLATLAPDDPQIGVNWDVIAAIQLQRGEFEAAEDASAEALAVLRAGFEGATPAIADALFTRAMTRLRAGENEAALTAFRELLATELELFGPRHPNPITDRLRIAELLLALDRPAEALEGLGPLLEDALAVHPSTHRQVVRARALLGAAALATGALEIAERELSTAFEVGLGEGHLGELAYHEVPRRLAELYRATDRPELAASVLERAPADEE